MANQNILTADLAGRCRALMIGGETTAVRHRAADLRRGLPEIARRSRRGVMIIENASGYAAARGDRPTGCAPGLSADPIVQSNDQEYRSQDFVGVAQTLLEIWISKGRP